jgi:L-asparaginase
MTRILLIHTGGTIGMAPGPQGLAPSPGLLEAALRDLTPAGMTVEVISFSPLIDSADIGPDHWNRIIGTITAGLQATGGHEALNGVIVTHGTDTMAYTGAALDAALAGIAVPVVLCGSMVPLGAGGDAEANLALALDLAQHAPAGLWLAFAGQQLPGGSVIKVHAHQADAFRAVPDLPPLPQEFAPGVFAPKRLAVVTLTPGLPVEVLAAMLAPLAGAVLRVYGSGTMRNDPALAEVLGAAILRGCRIVAVSQCEAGGLDPGSYAAGAALWQAGVINGATLTPEAALARLWLGLI